MQRIVASQPNGIPPSLKRPQIKEKQLTTCNPCQERFHIYKPIISEGLNDLVRLGRNITGRETICLHTFLSDN